MLCGRRSRRWTEPIGSTRRRIPRSAHESKYDAEGVRRRQRGCDLWPVVRAPRAVSCAGVGCGREKNKKCKCYAKTRVMPTPYGPPPSTLDNNATMHTYSNPLTRHTPGWHVSRQTMQTSRRRDRELHAPENSSQSPTPARTETEMARTAHQPPHRRRHIIYRPAHTSKMPPSTQQTS